MPFVKIDDFKIMDMLDTPQGAFAIATYPSGFRVLVADTDAKDVIILSGDAIWTDTDLSELETFDAAVFDNVRIEIDVDSPADDQRNPPIGSIYRNGTQLKLRVLRFDRGQTLAKNVVIADGMLDCQHRKVAFTKWRIVMGAGDDLIVLWTSPDLGEQAKK